MSKIVVFVSSLACAIAVCAQASATQPCPGKAAPKEKHAQPAGEKGAASTAPAANAPEASDEAPKGICALPAKASAPKALPEPSRAQSLFYLRLGESAIVGPDLQNGPGAGFGYRMELDRVGIDAAASFAMSDVPHKATRGIEGSWLKLTAQYYFDPEADRTFYLGGGLSWGARTASMCNQRYTGSGLQAEIVGGYELLRSSTLRVFIQADATLPLYLASLESPATTAATPRWPTSNVARPPAAAPAAPGQRFLPTMGISLGIAWGRPSCARPQSTTTSAQE
jgi:opacity protein-like surface antigen